MMHAGWPAPPPAGSFDAPLSMLPPQEQKKLLGERLFPRVMQLSGPLLCAKVTGMLLDADGGFDPQRSTPMLLDLLASEDELRARVAAAVELLRPTPGDEGGAEDERQDG